MRWLWRCIWRLVGRECASQLREAERTILRLRHDITVLEEGQTATTVRWAQVEQQNAELQATVVEQNAIIAELDRALHPEPEP